MKTFLMEHLFFPDVIVVFYENCPPLWLTSKEYNWWWQGHLLTLPLGNSIKSDFRKITRIG